MRLKIADTVRASFDDLGVVQTTLDLLQCVVRERQEDRGREHGVVGWDGEHYQMVRLGPEATEERISEIQEVLPFAKILTLVPAEAEGEIKGEAKELFEDLDPAYLDTILAARGDDRILLSDDLPFRALAAEIAQVKSVWTQAAVAFAVGEKAVSPEEYFQLGNTLAEAGYFFTMLNVENFFHALKQSNWSITPTLQSLIDLLARAANAPEGVLNVLGDLVQIGWAQKPSNEAFEALFTAIFSAFKKAQPARDLEPLAAAAFVKVHRFLGSRFEAQFRDRLLQSTNLTPVATVAAQVRRIQKGLAAQIGGSLGEAVRKAGVEPRVIPSSDDSR